MKNAKHIIAIFIVLGVLATAAYLLPKSDIESLWAKSDTPAEEIIQETAIKNLKICPSNINLAGAEVQLVSMMSREQRLREKLEIEAE